jgi:hypothetical protein
MVVRVNGGYNMMTIASIAAAPRRSSPLAVNVGSVGFSSAGAGAHAS